MRFVMWHLQCMVHSLGRLHRRTWLTFLVLTALRGPVFNLSMGVKACGVADVAECPMEADATGRFTLSALCFEPVDFAPDNNYCFRDDIAVRKSGGVLKLRANGCPGHEYFTAASTMPPSPSPSPIPTAMPSFTPVPTLNTSRTSSSFSGCSSGGCNSCCCGGCGGRADHL